MTRYQPDSILNRIQHAIHGKPTATSTAAVGLDNVLRWGRTAGKEYAIRLRDANPLNVVLALVAVYLLFSLLKPHSIAKLTPTLAKARSSKCNANTSYSFLPDQHPPTSVWKRYTPRTLAVHDGSGLQQAGKSGQHAGGATDGTGKSNEAADARILLAISGRVFDVTRGANFYGPGGPYGNFAGRDASRGMAKQSFDLEMLTPLDKPLDTLEDLSPMEVNNMREWMAHFTSKYTVVGELVNEGEEDEA